MFRRMLLAIALICLLAASVYAVKRRRIVFDERSKKVFIPLVKEDVEIPKPDVLIFPSEPSIILKGMFPVWEFSNVSTDELHYSYLLPKSWKSSLSLECTIYWAPTDPNSDPNYCHVAWEIDWAVYEADPNTVNIEMHDDTEGPAYELLTAPIGTISDEALHAGNLLAIKVSRDHDDTDTYESPVILNGIQIQHVAGKKEKVLIEK